MKKSCSSQLLQIRRLLCYALAVCLYLALPNAFAQSSNATLRGQVSRAQAGAVVLVTNTATGLVRRSTLLSDGTYAMTGLPPGQYTISVGGVSRTVTLSVASSVTVNLDAGVPISGDAKTLDAVQVTGQTIREVKTSEIGNTIALRQIQQLPQATRNFLEFADTVPGMAFNIDPQGRTTLRAGASNSSASNLYIDGVGQKSYVAKGGISGQNDSQGSPFPQLAIGEYKIITSNYKAEYGQIGGAAVTAATKSGTNEFHGETFYRYTNQNLRDRRPDEGETKVDSQTKEYGFALGGPIIRDRMHFFFAYEGKDNVVPRSVQADARAAPYVHFLPSYLSQQYGAVNLPFNEDLFFGKIDFEPSGDDRLELSVQYRDETQIDNIGGQNAADHGLNKTNKDKRGSLRWQHSADAWFNELIFTRENARNNPNPMSIGNGFNYVYLDETDPNIGEYTFLSIGPDGGSSMQRRHQDGWSLQNDLTFTSVKWHGDHTIKMGVSYKNITLQSQDAASLNPQFSYAVSSSGVATTPYRVDFYSPYATPGQKALVETRAKQYGLYLQDDWNVNEKLTLNLGMRWDYEDNPAYTNFVTSQAFVAALYADDPENPGHPWANRLLPSGINVADYISNGHNRHNFNKGWAPRFGFSYDIYGDEAAVMHGGAGRSYDRNLFEQMAYETSKAALSPVAVYFQDPATHTCYHSDRLCVPWDPKYLNGIDQLNAIAGVSGSGELFIFNNKLKTPYSDQYSIGISNKIGGWLTDVTFQRVLSNDGFVMSLVNRYPDGRYFDAEGNAPWDQSVPGHKNTILGMNGLKQRSSQVLLSVEKPYSKESGWGVNVAYTHTSARQNRTIDEPFAFDKATIYEYPFVKSDAVAAHRLVVSGSMDGLWGMTFGAKVVLATPTPINTIACYGQIDPDGANCQQVGVIPPSSGKFLVGGNIWGYRTVDFQASKEFTVFNDFKLSARVNLLNAFNFKNYASYVYNSFGSDGRLQPDITINRIGDINYVPRTVTFELGMKF